MPKNGSKDRYVVINRSQEDYHRDFDKTLVGKFCYLVQARSMIIISDRDRLNLNWRT